LLRILRDKMAGSCSQECLQITQPWTFGQNQISTTTNLNCCPQHFQTTGQKVDLFCLIAIQMEKIPEQPCKIKACIQKAVFWYNIAMLLIYHRDRPLFVSGVELVWRTRNKGKADQLFHNFYAWSSWMARCSTASATNQHVGTRVLTLVSHGHKHLDLGEFFFAVF
jgi:hypothetical protein